MNVHRSLYTYSFDSGINSGKYSTLSPHMQKELSIVYSAFKQLNNMRNIYKPNMSHEQLKELSQGIETLYKNMKLLLPDTINNLKSEITK